MTDIILTLNSGSSSIKFSLFAISQDLPLLAHGKIEGLGAQGLLRTFDHATGQALVTTLSTNLTYDEGLNALIEWSRKHIGSGDITAVGHRVVHGGTHFSQPVKIDNHTVEQLKALTPLAPLHQPHNIAGIRACFNSLPDASQVACFDTAFHRDQPEIAQQFALPRDLMDAGIRRYGFHGLSYEHIASTLPRYLGDPVPGKVVVAHLGNGASMCALRDGRSIASTTGFTALDGLPMGTRCGSLDPGVVLYLLQEKGFDSETVTDLLYHKSGLLGVSGISHDMRTLLASPNPGAKEAIELFTYRIGRELGSLSAALGGLDALVFTGGIGEHAAPVRQRVCQHAAWLGVQLDPVANKQVNTLSPSKHPARISIDESPVSVWVIPTDEERMIATHTRDILANEEIRGDKNSGKPDA